MNVAIFLPVNPSFSSLSSSFLKYSILPKKCTSTCRSSEEFPSFCLIQASYLLHLLVLFLQYHHIILFGIFRTSIISSSFLIPGIIPPVLEIIPIFLSSGFCSCKYSIIPLEEPVVPNAPKK